jgi:hypothetical protein
MMCLAVVVDVWGLVIAVAAIGGVNVTVIALFLRHLRGREHSCHDFQRQLNDNTREAFKSILVTLNDTKHALNTSSEVTLQAMTLMGQMREEMREGGQKPPDRGSH